MVTLKAWHTLRGQRAGAVKLLSIGLVVAHNRSVSSCSASTIACPSSLWQGLKLCEILLVSSAPSCSFL